MVTEPAPQPEPEPVIEPVPAPKLAITSVISSEGKIDAVQQSNGLTDKEPLIEGYAPPHSKVEIWVNGRLSLTERADANGKWSASRFFIEGEYNLQIKVGSLSSEAVKINVSAYNLRKFIAAQEANEQENLTPIVTEPAPAPAPAPKLAITSVISSAGNVDAVQQSNGLTDNEPRIAGFAPPHAKVELWVNGRLSLTEYADADGNWSASRYFISTEHSLQVKVGSLSSEPVQIKVAAHLVRQYIAEQAAEQEAQSMAETFSYNALLADEAPQLFQAFSTSAALPEMELVISDADMQVETGLDGVNTLMSSDTLSAEQMQDLLQA